MMIAAPGLAPGRSSATVMEMDLMPTLASLAGLGVAVPQCPVAVKASRAMDLCTESHDLGPLLREPAAAYFLLFGRFFMPLSPKAGVIWVNLAEKSGHILCNWQQRSPVM